MKRAFIIIMGGVTSLVGATAARAAPPAWCKGASGEPDLRGLSSKDIREVLKTFVAAECSPNAEVESHRGEIEAARQAWSKRLGMAEAEWADAVAYLATDDYSIKPAVSARTLAAATPIDQYAVITRAGESFSKIDTMYATDMFEANLSEAGRLAFVQTTCLGTGPASVSDEGMTGTEVTWAICQADIERVDVAKLLGEIRADTTHDGAARMKLRIAAYDLPRRLKDHAAEVQEMLKRDDANQKLFEAARAGRSEWASGIGKNTRLLDLVLAMDSAAIMESRKQFEGCSETTAAALAEAVATIPARAFTGMQDERYGPTEGFAARSGAVLGQSPAVSLASIAFLRCAPEGDVSELLQAVLYYGPPSRGPRNTALTKIKNTKITYDKVGAKLIYPRSRPHGEGYPGGLVSIRSGGGAVKTVKRAGDKLTVEIQQTKTAARMECVRSHKTNRIAKIHGDGRVQYEEICDESKLMSHDNTWAPFKLSAKYAAWLKPGVVFSATGEDVIAVWPNASAKTPSMVLGGAVK